MAPEDPPAVSDPFDALLEDSAEDLYENAPCGYFSTLPDGTIARANATFLTWTGYARSDLIGRRRFQTMLAVGDRIFYETHYAPLLRMQQAVREIAVEIVCADGRRLPVLINSTVKTDADGEVAYFRTSVFDARQRRQYERELLRARQQAEESETRAREFAQTLQESFIPPVPAEIPGLEVGAAYRPAGRGAEVGGDFYDVFATADDTWIVVLGDVRGKGVLAARVTALARYTLRAAAMQPGGPASVLARLNDALRRSDEDRFCTVAFASIFTGGGKAEITLAAGGHELPILVDAAGGAAPVGQYGDLIGVMEQPAFPETLLGLQPGDALCFFTDGVTDGRRGDEYYGEQRLLRTLADAAGHAASVIADTIVEDVVTFQNGMARDDIAVLVLKRPAQSQGPQPGP